MVTRAQQAPAVDGTWRNALEAAAWATLGVAAVVGLMVLSIGTQFASSLVPFAVAAWYVVLSGVVAPRGGGTVGLWGCVVLAAWIVTVLILGMVVY